MTVTSEARKQILSVVLAKQENFEGSDAQYAVSLGINKSVFSRLKKGETERVMSDAAWVTVARRLGVMLGNEPIWMPAQTAVYQYITTQLALCQMEGLTGIYCDYSGIGKSYAAKEYCLHNKNAVYVDCSQVKNKQKLVRFIAKSFGLDNTGKYADVYDDLVYYLKVITKPIIVLDEAGDLDYAAFLELKALWNAAEHFCGWYMMGADGLERKINKGIANRKVGFTEIFNRFGNKYNHITPKATDERTEFLYEMAVDIVQINYPECKDVQRLITKSGHHLRSLYSEIIKLKRQSA